MEAPGFKGFPFQVIQHICRPNIIWRTRNNLNTKSGDLSNVISIDNNLVSRLPSNKCLGVLLDEKLTFETHIEYICKKACADIGALRRIKPFVPICTLVTLYRSLIEPYFDNCSPLWDTCGKQLKDNLHKFKNRAGRVITGSSYDVRSADVLNNLNGKPLKPGASIQRLPLCNKSSMIYLPPNWTTHL